MFVFWRNQNNRNGLTPANGISPNFVLPQKFLSDSNKFFRRLGVGYEVLGDWGLAEQDVEDHHQCEAGGKAESAEI